MIGAIWILIGVVLLGYYNGVLILDDKTSDSDIKNDEIKNKWHFIGAMIFLYLASSAWLFFGFEYVPLTISLFWSLFAGIVHRVGLKKSFFFVGTTAKTDIIIRKLFPKNPQLWSAIIKLICVGLSLFFTIVYS